MDDMQEAMGCFIPDSMAYIMAGPRDPDGLIGVRFGGYERDLKRMFQEIATHLYEAMIISEEQWQVLCGEDAGPRH